MVSKLGRKTPTKANELMDIATKFASGQEAIEALFHMDKVKRKRKEDTPKASTQRNPRKGKKKKVQQGPRETLATELVVAAEKRNPEPPRGGWASSTRCSKEFCPYHKGPVKHILGESDMLWRFYNKPSPSVEEGSKKGPGDGEDGKGNGFLDVESRLEGG